ncbi:MAG: NUDIX hydrolase [Verrucomicrobiota bacterium]
MKPQADVFDIVNERDEVIGQATRAEAHAKNLRHRAVHIWILNRKGEFLLQKRSATKDTCPCMWTSSVCGHVDAGENYEEAAQREIIEEIGLKTALSIKEIGYEKACAETAMEFTRIYVASCEGPFQFPQEEISELKWMSFKKIQHIIQKKPETLSPIFIYLWNKFDAHDEHESDVNL